MIKCPKCKRELPEDSKFCNYCGKRFLTSSEKSTKKKVIAVVAVALAVVIALSGFLIFDRISNKSEENITNQKSDKANQQKETDSNEETNNKEENAPVMNTGDKDIYQAPNGKYYVLTKVTTTDHISPEVHELEYVWSANSVEWQYYGNSIYEFNDDGQQLSTKTAWWSEDDQAYTENPREYKFTYTNGHITGITEDATPGYVGIYSSIFNCDKNGNIIKQTTYSDEDITNIINLSYDSENRLIKYSAERRNPDGTFKDEYRYKYVDENTVILDYVNINGDIIDDLITLHYNEYGKITDFIYKDFEEAEQSLILDFEYDENQNLIKVDCSIISNIENSNIYSVSYEFEWAEGTKTQAIFTDNLIENEIREIEIPFYRYPLTYIPFV